MAHPGHERDLDARTSSSENPYTASPSEHPPSADAGSPRRSRALRIGAPVAALAVAATAVFGVLSADAGDTERATASPTTSLTGAINDVVDRRVEAASRGAARNVDDPKTLADNPKKLQAAYDNTLRRTITAEAVDGADTKRWTNADLNLWTLPGNQAKKVGLLGEKKHVLITGRKDYGRTEIVVKNKSRWVTSGYLQQNKPVEPKPKPTPTPTPAPAPEADAAEERVEETPEAPAATGTCSNGSSVSPGVSPNVAAVHQAICASFPDVVSYGDFRGDGEHAQGIALDAMVSGSRGQQVADFVRANAGSLGVNYVIYAQQIWSTDRAGEGWRPMSDRGSTTANHYDHVHVTTY